MSHSVIKMKQSQLPHVYETWKTHSKYYLFEYLLYGNIRSYDFEKIKVKACIDFVAIKFSTDLPQKYTHIKKYLTEKTEQAFYIEPLGIPSKDAMSVAVSEFKIVLQDVKSYRDLERRLKPLAHYSKGLNIDDLQIVELETALDFYGANPKILVALLKSIRLKGKISNIRFFGKGQSNSHFLNVYDGRRVKNWISPFSGNIFQYLESGGCADGSNGNFAINDKSDDRYFHGYYKTVDKKKVLPVNEHRPRLEVKLQGEYLTSITIATFGEALKRASKELSFTAVKENTSNREYIRTLIIKPYGLEDSSYKTKSNLSPYIESYSELNCRRIEAFRNLIKAFNKPLQQMLYVQEKL